MDLHKFIAETRKITENDLMMQDEEVGEVGAERPVVDDELINNLATDNPDMAEVDQEELKKGLDIEMAHFDSVGGDINVIANLAMDNIRKYPGQSYYTALAQLETELGQAEEQVAEEPIAEEPVAEEPPVSTEEPVVEPAPFESKVSEETVAAGELTVAKDEKMMKDEEEKLKKDQKKLDTKVSDSKVSEENTSATSKDEVKSVSKGDALSKKEEVALKAQQAKLIKVAGKATQTV